MLEDLALQASPFKRSGRRVRHAIDAAYSALPAGGVTTTAGAAPPPEWRRREGRSSSSFRASSPLFVAPTPAWVRSELLDASAISAFNSYAREVDDLEVARIRPTQTRTRALPRTLTRTRT